MNLNMFSVIGTGVAAAYLFSVVAVLAPGLFPAGFRYEPVPGIRNQQFTQAEAYRSRCLFTLTGRTSDITAAGLSSP
jgi:hypothetical protein